MENIALQNLFFFWSYSFRIEGPGISNQHLLLWGLPAPVWPQMYLLIPVIALVSKKNWQNITKIISKAARKHLSLEAPSQAAKGISDCHL